MARRGVPGAPSAAEASAQCSKGRDQAPQTLLPPNNSTNTALAISIAITIAFTIAVTIAITIITKDI